MGYDTVIARNRTGGAVAARLTCSEVSELLPWVAAGTASDGETALVHLHTLDCPACRSGLAETTALAERLGEAMASLPGLRPDLWREVPARVPDAETLLRLGEVGLPDFVVALARLSFALRDLAKTGCPLPVVRALGASPRVG
jgi:hypothetical protein